VDSYSQETFHSVVVADVEGSTPMNEPRIAALCHMKMKGGGFITVPHDPVPANEFFNPELFPKTFPTHYPMVKVVLRIILE
jgi:hypothetical protein